MKVSIHKSISLLALSVALATSACSSGHNRSGVETVTKIYRDGSTTSTKTMLGDAAANKALAQLQLMSALPVDQARAMVSGKTNVSYDLGISFGTQIEYNAPDGTNYLWFPGNKVILKAKWDVRTSREVVEGQDTTVMCFQYGTNTYNPATQTSGGAWECESFGRYVHTTVDRKDGDVFGISKTTPVPHILAKDAVSPYVPHTLPIDIPHLTNGKSPIEHMQDDFTKLKN